MLFLGFLIVVALHFLGVSYDFKIFFVLYHGARFKDYFYVSAAVLRAVALTSPRIRAAYGPYD